MRWCLLLSMALVLAACQPSGTPEKEWSLSPQGLYCGAFSPDRRWLLAATSGQGIGLWPLPPEQQTYQWDHGEDEATLATACGFSADGRFALTADRDQLVLWSTRSGEALRYWSVPSRVHALTLTANGRYALLGLASGEAALFDIQNGGVLRVFSHSDDVIAVALATDGRRALTGSDDYSARLWNLDTGEELQRWELRAPVGTVALSSNGNLAFTSSRFSGGLLWDTASGERLWQLPDRASRLKRGRHYSSARLLGAQRLLTGTGDREVQLWDWGSQRELHRWLLPQHHWVRPEGGAVLDLLETDTGAILALASDGYTYRLGKP